jgi:hypothetical protein
MKLLVLLLPALSLAVGCAGPTRTAGTKGIAANQLAVLHVTRQYDVPLVRVSAVRFDDAGDKYKIDDDGRDFYLTPGVHHVGLDLTAKIESPIKWLSFGEHQFEGPPGLSTGDLQPGKTYELRGIADTVQGLVGGGDMAITREMVRTK